MKTYIADIIPKIQRFGQKLNDLTKLTDSHWVSLDDIPQIKRVFIFRTNKQLLISDNGVVEKGSWEYLGNQSLLIDTKNESYLLKHGFFDENIIALKLDSTERYIFFINETKYGNELNNIEDIISFLTLKYLNNAYQEGKKVESKYFSDENNIFIPLIAAIKRDRIEFADGVKTEVIKDIEGRYFIVSNYTRYYYNSHSAAIDASYIFKVTGKISRVNLNI